MGADKGQKKKKKGAVSTEASAWRDLEFGGSRLQRYGGLNGNKACTTTTYRDMKHFRLLERDKKGLHNQKQLCTTQT